MKRNYLVITMVTVLVAASVCLNVYAGKHEGIELPDAVKTAIDAIFPNADIEKVEMDQEGIECYEIEIDQGDVERELTITPDGTVIEEEMEIDVRDLPEAIQAKLAGTEIEEAKQEIEHYVIILKKLDNPKISYEVEVEQDGIETEIKFAADGTILEQKVLDDDDDDDDDHDDDNDDDDHDDD